VKLNCECLLLVAVPESKVYRQPCRSRACRESYSTGVCKATWEQHHSVYTGWSKTSKPTSFCHSCIKYETDRCSKLSTFNFYLTRTTTRSCRTRKRACNFYSPEVVPTQPRHVRARGPVAHAATLLRRRRRCCVYAIWWLKFNYY